MCPGGPPISGPRAAEETMSSERPSSRLEPHRGQMMMILGIVSIFVAAPILGPIAWIMANGDLKKMDTGVMDPAGRDSTKIGKICGMIATILGWGGLLLGLLICVCGGALGLSNIPKVTTP
jgi:hypothetical protein